MTQSLERLLNHLGLESDRHSIRATAIGLIVPVLAERSPVADRFLGWHLERLCAAYELGQLGCEFDRFGQFASFALWANVSREQSNILLQRGLREVEAIHLGGGDETWILELFAQYGELPLLLARLRDDWLCHSTRVTYFRYKQGKRIAKRISRSDQISFLRAPRALATDWAYLDSSEGRGLQKIAHDSLVDAKRLGELLLFLENFPGFSEMPLRPALERLRGPLSLQQSKVFKDDLGKVVAYLAWAWVDEDLLQHGLPELQWLPVFRQCEGRNLLVCEAIAESDALEDLLADLSVGIFSDEPLWLRPTPQGPGVARPRLAQRGSLSEINVSMLNTGLPQHVDVLRLMT
jgi:hemolysin-activating ACP:hemolysin acyltransferase